MEALDARALALLRGEVSETQTCQDAWRVRVYLGLDVVHGVWLEGGGCCLFALLRHPSPPCPSPLSCAYKSASAESGHGLAGEQTPASEGSDLSCATPAQAPATTRPQVQEDSGTRAAAHPSPHDAKQTTHDGRAMGGMHSHGLDWEPVMAALRHFDLDLHS